MLFCAKALVVTLLAVAAPYLKANAQSWAWVTAAGGPPSTFSYANGSSIATDADGNVYVVGNFEGPSIIFGTTTFANQGGWDLFWAKYGPSGNLIWVKTAGGTGIDNANAVFTDNTGHVYFTGSFNSGHVAMDALTMYNNDSTGSSSSQDFVVKCNISDGSCIWVKTSQSSLSSSPHGSCSKGFGAVDASGNVYLSGQVDLGVASFDGASVTALGTASIFLVKYDASGAVQWVKSGGNTSGTVLRSCQEITCSYIGFIL